MGAVDSIPANHRRSSASSGPSYEQSHFVIVTDAGQDCDDELALTMLFALIKSKDISQDVTVVANLYPAADRARLVEGLVDTLVDLNKLYLHDGVRDHIHIAVGTDGGDKTGTHHNNFLKSGSTFVSKKEVETNGSDAFILAYKYAEKKKAPSSITILCISSMTDVASFAMENGDLFAKYTKEVVMMGGATIENATSTASDSSQYLIPEKDAHNNLFDMEASTQLFKICQARKVRMVIFSRHASLAIQFPPKLYDDLASTKCPIAIRLRDTQKHDLDILWRRSIGTTPEERQGLPDRCNRAWYLKTFCGGENVQVDDDAIWNSVVKLSISDLGAIVAAVPKYRQKFFSPKEVIVNGVAHQLIGTSASEPCVTDPSGYLEFATAALLTTCAGDPYPRGLGRPYSLYSLFHHQQHE
jgi:hypothetical protein